MMRDKKPETRDDEPTCDHKDCDSMAVLQRELNTGYVVRCCADPKHDPWADETVRDCVIAPKVGP